MAAGNDNKVDTALLARTAETLSPLVKNLDNIFEQFQQEVKSSRGEWQGDKSDDIRNTAAQLKSSSAEITKVLNGYISGLKELAGVYDKAESKVQNTAQSLKFDSVFKWGKGRWELNLIISKRFNRLRSWSRWLLTSPEKPSPNSPV